MDSDVTLPSFIVDHMIPILLSSTAIPPEFFLLMILKLH